MNKPLSSGDAVSMLIMMVTGFYLIINSGINLYAGENAYVLTLAAGIGMIYALYRFYTRSTSISGRPETLAEHFKPILDGIEDSKANQEEIFKRLEAINYNIERVVAQDGNKSLSPHSVHHMTMLFRYNLLITLSLAFYIFMVFFPQWYTFYLSLIMFILWWALITYHHQFWGKPEAWYWLIIPFVFIPLFVIVFTSLYPITIMFGILFFGLIAYSFLYYTWCRYAATGIIPFDIGRRINDIKKKLKTKEPETN